LQFNNASDKGCFGVVPFPLNSAYVTPGRNFSNSFCSSIRSIGFQDLVEQGTHITNTALRTLTLTASRRIGDRCSYNRVGDGQKVAVSKLDVSGSD